nr:copia protein [Tanacetum cinerariifolium]
VMDKAMTDEAEDGPTNFAFMSYTSSSSSSSDSEDFNKSQLNLCAYKAGLESVKARLEVYKKNEAVFEEDIKILKLDVMFRDKAITELRQKFKNAKKERDDLKLTLEKFEGSSKNLSRLLDSQQCDKSKTGLGYDSQGFDSQVLENQNNMYSVDLRNVAPSRENLIDHKVNIIRCDNETKFKNKEMNQFCEIKGIRREFSVVRILQQNGIAEKKNKTLIKAARTILADSKLPTTFWAKAVNTACYVQNRVLVVKPHNKTPYELFLGRKAALSFMGPFGCPVTILNTLDHLGLKSSEGEVLNDAEKKSTKVPRKEYGVQDPTKEGDKMIKRKMLEIKRRPLETNLNKNLKDCLVKRRMLSLTEERAQRNEFKSMIGQEKDANGNKIFTLVSAAGSTYVYLGGSIHVNAATLPNDPLMLDLEDTADLHDSGIFSGAYDDEVEGTEADFNNLELTIKVWRLVDFPKGKHAIGTKWVYRNKKDERGIVIRNNTRLLVQGYTHKEGIDYDELFAPVARIEAIRLFLAYASFMGFIVYQIDVKSAFLYGIIEEEVYVCQPLGFVDLHFPNKVYKAEKALYDLDQAPRAWYETLSTYLLENRFRRGIIDKTYFIKKDKDDILMKAKMEEEEKIAKEKDEANIAVIEQWDKVQAKIDANIELAQKLQTKEQEQLTDAEKARLFMELLENRRKFVARKREIEKRSTPPTKAQQRNLMLSKAIWMDLDSAKVKTFNEDVQIRALIDGKKIIVTEAYIRRDLQLQDVEGTTCLPNDTIFEELARIGAKTTAWNEFSSTMASAIICLANNQKFNFSNEDRMQLTELMNLCINLQQQVLDLEKAKTAQAKEIVDLKKRVKKLERKKSQGLQEDASKQRRMIDNIDQDEEIALVDETQGRMNEEEMFGVNNLDGDEVVMDATTGEEVEQSTKVAKKEVSTANPVTTASEVVTTTEDVEVTTAATTLQIFKDELTMAQTLIEIKVAKPKARGVIVQDPNEFKTSSSQPLQLPQAKEKGKGIMVEPEKPLKKKDQIAFDEKITRKLEA